MSKHQKSKKASSLDWHNADIKAALEKAGWSLARLSIHHGYSRHVIKHALAKPYPAAEKLIAAAINVTPQEIWPSRYNLDGTPVRVRQQSRPIRKVRPNKNSSSPLPRNAQQGTLDAQ